ncbi:hypothetical protein Mp_7g05340 [Marchantia polymorpha subsp. ruderalis]|uniref:Uncharacterized protein n=2 Tax=Marchantia polymorpha TaxID=3197 RepID=A0AAF6BWD3_MARPO|nr:hypothetical protein MARPO_0218s0002 [Marchantia polymorpha]BBN16317.1 hypothetical protein Mp_7g05340 [Marchantia polymorpha subsp. ruderalis]|eukprot:PTQ27122.1 hypothetical protein MARPO_0218s0002 [Marchantia polymorpha]
MHGGTWGRRRSNVAILPRDDGMKSDAKRGRATFHDRDALHATTAKEVEERRRRLEIDGAEEGRQRGERGGTGRAKSRQGCSGARAGRALGPLGLEGPLLLPREEDGARGQAGRGGGGSERRAEREKKSGSLAVRAIAGGRGEGGQLLARAQGRDDTGARNRE